MRIPLSKQSSAGFTLIEMIVVTLMIGILFTIAAPSWLAFANRQRANTARNQVQQAVQRAQSEAIRTRQGQTLEFDTDADPPTFKIFTDDPAVAQAKPLGDGQYEAGMIGLTPSEPIEFDEKGNLSEDFALPVKLTVTAPRDTERAKTCVIIETLLGATRTGSDDECNG
jgi:prepilin-type N-terminal cleavage/methylation domain-containing protein